MIYHVLLSSIITDGEIKLSTTDLHGNDYHLVAANLKNLTELEHKLKECDIDYSVPTIIFAECVLVYIEKSKTDELLRWIADHFTSVFFVNYEQVGLTHNVITMQSLYNAIGLDKQKISA